MGRFGSAIWNKGTITSNNSTLTGNQVKHTDASIYNNNRIKLIIENLVFKRNNTNNNRPATNGNDKRIETKGDVVDK